VGVEEELMLFDARTGDPAPVGDAVAEDGPSTEEGEPQPVEHEFKLEQVETATDPELDLAELRSALLRRRGEVLDRAGREGAVVAAIATNPLPIQPTLTPGERYARMQAAFGLVARQELTCGMHIHVSVDSPDEGVAAIDRIRSWLPVLLALTASSPYWQGEDTGMASFRSAIWSIWPTAGPTELFGDAAAYAATVADLVASGAALDPGMIYFDARLSTTYPTVEVRVPDVCTEVDDAVAVAGLCRALVDRAVADWRDGRAAPAHSRALVRAGAWVAARHGLADRLLDGRTLRSVPATEALRGLLHHTAGALEAHGDLDRVRETVERICRDGTSAARQRAVMARTGDLDAVVRDAVGRTAAALV
jgi:carboxylate-amine ligase